MSIFRRFCLSADLYESDFDCVEALRSSERLVNKGSQTTVLKKLIITQISSSNSHSIHRVETMRKTSFVKLGNMNKVFAFGDVENFQTQLLISVSQIHPISENHLASLDLREPSGPLSTSFEVYEMNKPLTIFIKFPKFHTKFHRKFSFC